MSANTSLAGAAAPGAAINPIGIVWVALAFAAVAAAIAFGSLWALNFMHVMAGVLWTGIDLFMVRDRADLARRAVRGAPGLITRLTPKTLFLMPTLSI